MFIYWLLLAIPATGAFLFTRERGAPETPTSRIFLWFFLAVQALFIIWIAGGLGLLAVTRHRTTETGPIAGTPVKPAA